MPQRRLQSRRPLGVRRVRRFARRRAARSLGAEVLHLPLQRLDHRAQLPPLRRRAGRRLALARGRAPQRVLQRLAARAQLHDMVRLPLRFGRLPVHRRRDGTVHAD